MPGGTETVSVGLLFTILDSSIMGIRCGMNGGASTRKGDGLTESGGEGRCNTAVFCSMELAGSQTVKTREGSVSNIPGTSSVIQDVGCLP